MYDGVVTWNPIAGKCSHGCGYCYMNAMRRRWNNPKWEGCARLDPNAFRARFKTGSRVFVQSISDLFSDDVPAPLIFDVLEFVERVAIDRDITFIFQSRNVERMEYFAEEWLFPVGAVAGTTIETNRYGLFQGPFDPDTRSHFLRRVGDCKDSGVEDFIKTFVTIEPVMKFDLERMLWLIRCSGAKVVNIGADSKRSGLEEPSMDELLDLISGVREMGLEVNLKKNLKRILGEDGVVADARRTVVRKNGGKG